MVAITSGTPVISAVAEAHRANAGIAGYAIATIAGLLLAASNAWAESRIADAVDARVKHLPGALKERYLGALYLAAFVWMLVAAFIGMSISLAILRWWN